MTTDKEPMTIMLNWLRNLLKSKDEQRQERLTAYLDGALSAAEQKRVEQELAQDAALRAEVEAQQRIKYALSQLPRRAAPRNFILDPAKYVAKRPSMAAQIYPTLRVATAVMTVLLVGVIALDFGTRAGQPDMMASAPAAESQPIAQADMAAEPAQEMELEATQGLTETSETQEGEDALAEDSAMATFAIEPAAESAATEMAEEEVAEEEMAAAMAPEAASVPPAAPSGGMGGGAPEAGEETANQAEFAPRPTATASMDARAADPMPTPAATAIPAPTQTAPTPAPLPADELITPKELAPTAAHRTPWRTTQLILGTLVALLLTTTLLIRRKL